MSSGKKVLNVFGIIFASILSIVLVISLIVTPIMFSSLSLLSPKNLSGMLTSMDISELLGSGEDTEQKEMAALLSTTAAKEVFELYATDITNSLSGKDVESKLTAEALKKIVEDNIDELVAVMREVDAAPSDVSDEEIKTALKGAIATDADKLLENLPKPQDLMQQITAENPEMQTAFDIMGSANTIKLSVIGAVVVLSALIFVCRLFELRGFKWLSVDLFVVSGILILVCAGLFLGSGVVNELLSDNAMLSDVVISLLSSFKTGMVIRTAVILVFAIGLMVAYVFIKKARTQKVLAAENVEVVLEDTVTETAEEVTEEN